MDVLADVAVPSVVGLIVWFFTRNDRETFDRMQAASERHLGLVEKDRDYWRSRAIACERGEPYRAADRPHEPPVKGD